MIITDYYKFEKTALLSASRMDCVASTKSYPEFEEKRKLEVISKLQRKTLTLLGL